ncbi:sensor histidine kinase [Paludisphaera mucosa]|uniref:histidine kinase n=1 Tax=Paludisphaera mucosa TaxID=3030827 RepID=A0ABT6FDG9_9BACT|nr:HAMP domain-containing sensor histidine kinase [Paludisphaera mucosa]MDG3005531.1 HAMP domain-containing sensor histidine kinase [Paludisphaera mucosa]
MSDPSTIGRSTAAKTSEPMPNVLGHVASSVVHSVINHFSAIVSQAEMLKTRALPAEEVARRADAIIGAALVGSTLGRRLAEYSRRATTADLQPVDLDRLIADRLEARREDAPAGVALAADLSARAVFPGDAPRLVIMLDCLLDNGFEALDEIGGGVLTVSTRLDPLGWLELDVRDDGPGMAPDVLEQALEPFFSTKPDHPGLGLPLARSLWRRHRGAFSIDAPQGRGTLVRLTRPPAEPPSST